METSPPCAGTMRNAFSPANWPAPAREATLPYPLLSREEDRNRLTLRFSLPRAYMPPH